MKYSTQKSLVMFRPHDIKLAKTPPLDEGLPTVTALVADKSNLGWVVKYKLRFDDDVVSRGAQGREGRGGGGGLAAALPPVGEHACMLCSLNLSRRTLLALASAALPTAALSRRRPQPRPAVPPAPPRPWAAAAPPHASLDRPRACPAPPLPFPAPPTPVGQTCEFQASLDQDEAYYNFDVGSRVHVHVGAHTMLGFNPNEVDSAPIV